MSDDVLDAEGDALAADELGAARPRPRALTAAELARSLAQGQRAAWLLEPDLAALYARHIADAYRLAAKALPRIAKHSPAGGLSAAMDPAERAQKQHETTRRTRSAAQRASSRTPGSGGWSMPDKDELGVALRRRMDEEWERKQKGQTPEAIRIEAMRRTTAAGLELMHVSFDVRNPLVEGVLAQLGGKITEIEDTTRRDIMRSLDESWQKGDSIPRAAKKLRATSEQVSLSRGRLIARTEILGAVNGGAHALGLLSDAIGRENGEPALLKVWLTAEDEHVRDTHVDAGAAYGNGSGIPMDEPFQVGDSRMQYPGDPDGAADEVCNCRCALSYEEAGAQAVEPAAGEAPASSGLGLALTDFLPAERAVAEGVTDDQAAADLGTDAPDIGSPDALAAERARYDADPILGEPAALPLGTPDAYGVSVTGATPTWDAQRTARMFRSQAVLDNGYTVQAKSWAKDQAGNRISVTASIQLQTPRGPEEVGTLSRSIHLRDKTVSHNSFFLNDEAQGKGIATDLLRSAVREYDAAGLERVEVQAAGKNGRYTWSRFGFDFRPGEADRMRASFRQQFYEYADNLPAGIVPKTGIVEGQTVVLGNDARLRAAFPETMARIDAAEHSWDFANLTVDENGQLLQNIGRDFMLHGPAWYGELDLTAGSPGRAIFDAYTGGKPPLTADANLEDAMSELPSIIPDDAQPIDTAGDGRAWTSVLCLEGVPTCDGRMLGIDSVGWRELPLTLLAQLSLEDAHGGAIVAGRIDRIEKMPAEDAVRAGLLCEREGGYPPDAVAVVGYGVFDDSALGDEVQRLVGDEVLRGISVDLAPERGEVLELPPVDGQELGALMEIMTAGSLMGATVCAHPAFAEASIRIDGADAEQPVVAAMRARTHLHVVTDAAIVLAPLEPARFAAQDHSAGSMIALHPAPAEADAIAQPGGQPAGDLHCTLAFLPDAGAVDFAALHKIVAGVAAEHEPISGKVGGAGYFAPSEPATVAAAPPEVPDAETPADGEDAEPPADAADPPAGAEPHPHVALVDAPGMSKMRAALCSALDDAGVPYAQNHDFTPHMTLGYEAEPSKPAMHVAGQPVSFGAISVHEGAARTDHPMGAPAITASAAGMAPEQPPSEWFENPELDGPTPITITDEGRIYGHLATWGTCHVGRPGECVEPPESLTDYALFHLGHVLTSDNELVPVGTLTLDTGHAGLTLGTTATQAHYDHTGTAAADVRCGEDDHGIWFAGAIRPDLDSRSVRALRAAKISGDWRPHNGTREMVAALAVNVPGFPVVRPRTAVAASGQLLGLVAAGVDLAPAAVPSRTRILELAERANPGTLALRREALALRARNALIDQA